jgi:hypothetical protein
VLASTLTLCALGSASVAGCSTEPDSTFASADGGANGAISKGTPQPGADLGDGGFGGVSTKQCTGLQCQQHTCDDGGTTTVSGIVYDPAAKNPLYNVVVYVPNSAVKPLTAGASCDACDALYSGDPIATTLTDASGRFTLTNVPDGANIPLVVQVGKWRKQVTVPNVARCADTALPDKSITLPKNHNEGDIPSIAISTGNADTLECLLRRVGIDAAEYGPGASNGGGRIHIFQGGTDAPTMAATTPASPQALWSTKDQLMPYDVVLMSCEGAETTGANRQALVDYTAAGGRVFASHYHYAWFNTGPFAQNNLATWSTTNPDPGAVNATIVTQLSNGQPFPKGVALKQWLGNVGALQNDELHIVDARHNADVGVTNSASQAWISIDQSARTGAGATEYFTFNTPVGVAADKQCGRVVFSDLHVGAASNDYQGGVSTVPEGCGADALSPQEKALEFMLFDLSSCVTPDTAPPAPPAPR